MRNGRETWLYFIANERRSHVKIGITYDPIKRLHALQAGNHEPLHIDLRLLFDSHSSAFAYEDALHQWFAPYWLHREWFLYAGPIADFAQKCSGGKIPSVPRPICSSAQAVGSYGECLRKDEFMAILKARSEA